MDTQPTFAELEYNQKQKTTHRERFLARMDALIPWEELEAEMAPFYPRRGQGRPPYPLAVMLRVHCLQLFYNRSDPGMEDDLYEMESLRRFAGLRLGGAIPDETTILNFRHLLERHGLGEILLSRINQHLAARGLRLREGTVVDSTLIAAPSSTQNEQKARDLEMHQTRKGKNWYFGMKLHIGVDVVSGWVHSLVTTPANVHDLTPVPELLHGCERLVWGMPAIRASPNGRNTRTGTCTGTSPCGRGCAAPWTRTARPRGWSGPSPHCGPKWSIRFAP